jgi:formate dehydrogenase subunit gamma
MATLTPQQREAVLRVVADLRTRPGPLLEILHGVQTALGFIPPDAVPLLAAELNLSRAEVHGVVTFYHHFRSTAPGRRTVRLCQAEACQSMGALKLAEHVKKRLGVEFHQTTADGQYTLEPVYCLGNCACSPALMIDEELQGRVTPDSFDALISGQGSQP